MKRRTLKQDEAELWERVAKTAVPLVPAKKRVAAPFEKPKKKSAQQKDIESAPIKHFKIGANAASKPPSHDLPPSISTALSHMPVKMDAKSYTKMRRGKLGPEDTMDLHGMTVAQAHGALINFIVSGHNRGFRLLLVITGKGKKSDDDGPIPRQIGVLRHQVPQWLRMAPIAPLILQVTEAHFKHGGGGAYYVYLRKRR